MSKNKVNKGEFKLGGYNCNFKTGFRLVADGILGITILVSLLGKACWKLLLGFGKWFMKFGDSQAKIIDRGTYKNGK